MGYNLPINQWLLVPDAFRPNSVVHSVCLKFVFHHIRPLNWEVRLADSSGVHRNETTIIRPGQVSLIIGLKPGFFTCVTMISPHYDSTTRYLAKEYETFYRLGQAKVWYATWENIFLGSFEIFNGPNPIDLH